MQKQPHNQAKVAKALLERGCPSQETLASRPDPASRGRAARWAPGGSGGPSPGGSPSALSSRKRSAASGWGEEGALAILLPLGLEEGLGPGRRDREPQRPWRRQHGGEVTGEEGRVPGSQPGLAARPSGGVPLTAWPGGLLRVGFAESAELLSPQARLRGDRKEVAAQPRALLTHLPFPGHQSHLICRLCAQGQACLISQGRALRLPWERVKHPAPASISGRFLAPPARASSETLVGTPFP